MLDAFTDYPIPTYGDVKGKEAPTTNTFILRKMKLIDYLFVDDFGKVYYLNILQIKRLCLLQFKFNIDLNEYTGSSGLRVNIGHSSLFGFDLHIWRYSVSVDVLSWFCRNLNSYREGIAND